MTISTLQDKLDQAGNAMTMLRESGHGTETGPITGGAFSNWHDQQLSWCQTAGLCDLSYHMTDLSVHGPDALRLVSELGVNSLANLAPAKADHMVAGDDDGYIIGDAVLDYVGRDSTRIVRTPVVRNWVQFHLGTGSYDVTRSRDEAAGSNALGHPAPLTLPRQRAEGDRHPGDGHRRSQAHGRFLRREHGDRRRPSAAIRRPQEVEHSRTPAEPLVNFDHDFIGRDALAYASDGPPRRKVTQSLIRRGSTTSCFSAIDRSASRRWPATPIRAIVSRVPFSEVYDK